MVKQSWYKPIALMTLLNHWSTQSIYLDSLVLAVKRLTEYILSVVFSVFFLLGGAGFTLSHYCCAHCRAIHCTTAHHTADTAHRDAFAKAHDCCWSHHFEVSTTEVSPLQTIPAQAENQLLALALPCAVIFDNIQTLSFSRYAAYTPPPYTYIGSAKGVLRAVCRWLI